jgi:hypothetical protein
LGTKKLGFLGAGQSSFLRNNPFDMFDPLSIPYPW